MCFVRSAQDNGLPPNASQTDGSPMSDGLAMQCYTLCIIFKRIASLIIVKLENALVWQTFAIMIVDLDVLGFDISDIKSDVCLDNQ